MPFSRDNHYVPRMYLKQFASSTGKICQYRILVSHSRVPFWQSVNIGQVAYQTDLYTRLAAGEESDEFEQWISREFETPAAEALRKATSDIALDEQDWRSIIRFTAAQVVRTPAFLEESFTRWNQTIPDAMAATLQDLQLRLSEARGLGPIAEPNPENQAFPLRTIVQPAEEDGMAELKIEVLVGRELWLYEIRRLLTNTLNTLDKHKWSIVKPAIGLQWFTSDDPVIRLNYEDEAHYDFKGGWGRQGGEILLPLGPDHLLYTQIGRDTPVDGSRFSREQSRIIRKIIAEHAHRHIFSLSRDAEVCKFQPRTEDAALFESEQSRWMRWHEEQSNAERDFRN